MCVCLCLVCVFFTAATQNHSSGIFQITFYRSHSVTVTTTVNVNQTHIDDMKYSVTSLPLEKQQLVVFVRIKLKRCRVSIGQL